MRYFEVAVKGIDTRAVAGYFVESVFTAAQFFSIDVDCGYHCRVDGGQYNVGRVFSAADYRLGRGYDVGVELVDAYVAAVDVFQQCVQNFTFGRAQVALYLGEQGDGRYDRHVFKVGLFPSGFLFAHGGFRHSRVEIFVDEALFHRIAYHRVDHFAVFDESLAQFLSFTGGGRKHDERGGFEVVLAFDVVDVAVFSVGFPHDTLFQGRDVVIERVGVLVHGCCLVIPLTRFLGVVVVVGGELGVERLVLHGDILGRAHETFLDLAETVEHVRRHVQGQHGSQDDIHEVYHLLSGRHIGVV